MPFFIAVYDVNARRVGKMLKLFRRYMTWVQNSVFEGELTEAQLKRLKAEAEQLMEPSQDGVVFYELGSQKYVHRTVLGSDKSERGPFL